MNEAELVAASLTTEATSEVERHLLTGEESDITAEVGIDTVAGRKREDGCPIQEEVPALGETN